MGASVFIGDRVIRLLCEILKKLNELSTEGAQGVKMISLIIFLCYFTILSNFFPESREESARKTINTNLSLDRNTIENQRRE
jgi:hypothetical protein